MNERTLCHIWNGLRFRHERLLDVDGQPLHLVYRGRWQAGPGPDFRGAIIARGDGRLLHGDVEVHLRTADWANHRHERDPLFNDVVLHVVLHHDGRASTSRQDGETVPVLALSDYLLDEPPPVVDGPLLPWDDEPCRRLLSGWSDEQVGALLDRAGDQRFRQHIAACEGDLAVLGPDETVYRRLFDALGYGQNRQPMRELACRVPYADLATAIHRLPAGERQPALSRLLLGAAGLDGGDAWCALFAPDAAPARQRRGRWRLAGLRPANSPVRRLQGAAALLAASAPGGLARRLCLDLPAGPPRAACRELRRRLVIPDPALGPRPWHLIGAGRAADIVVNVVLPCAAAYADLASRPALADAAWAAYRAHPKLGENEITRLMAGLLLGSERRRLAHNARRQQGLLHIFRAYCDLRRCGECPAAGASD